MNNLFGFGSTLGDLAKDINGFVREVVDELQTVATQDPDANDNDNDNIDNNADFDEEQAIEQELKHQLLQLSDDEENGSTIRDIDFEKAIEELQNESNENENENENETTNNPTDENESKNPTEQSKEQQQTVTQKSEQEQKEETKSLNEYNELHQKYVNLKQNFRKSIALVEKYQIYNQSLKETLNEQMIIREQQQSQINQQNKLNDELNQKVINLQDEINTLQTNSEKISIFESDSSKVSSPNNEMVLKSVNVGNNIVVENDNLMTKEENEKMRKTLQKAMVNMKELKKRYKKVKNDLCHKIEEFDQLKSQYVTYKISNSNKLKELKNKLKNIMNNNGLNKELQTILNAKFIEYGICKIDMINPLHLEMIGILNGCIETMTWICNNSSIGNNNNNIDDNKSDSVVIVNEHDNNNNNNIIEMDVNGLEGIKINVVSLREVVCEFIAGIQQWVKVLNHAIDRKNDGNQNGNNEKILSNAEEFQNID